MCWILTPLSSSLAKNHYYFIETFNQRYNPFMEYTECGIKNNRNEQKQNGTGSSERTVKYAAYAMSAFTPYKKLQSIAAKERSIEKFSFDLTSVLLTLPHFQKSVFNINYVSSVENLKPHGNTVNKSEKFFIKNILKSEENEEKQKRERKRLEFEEQASKMETIVSNMGKSEDGHRCIYCGKIYSRKYGLKIHIRTHTGYKPLKCKYCLRPFGDPSNLNKHVRLHARGQTPYNCQFCGKTLVRRRDLERHVKSKHTEPSLT